MLTGFPRNRRAFTSVARLALPLVGCLFAAAFLSWSRSSRTDSSIEFSPLTPGAVQAPPQSQKFGEEPSDVPVDSASSEERGKRIYSTGTSPSAARMTAVLGESPSEIPAVALKCVNCHLQDGRGKPEGGMSPSNIRWDQLTKPYGSTAARGRKRPPYDEKLLSRAITMGLDSAGKPLDGAMPHYRMTHGDLADLITYLKVLGRESDPGLTANRIRIGIIVPPSRMFPEMGPAVRAALGAFASEVNQAGGIYRRELELVFDESPSRQEDRAEAAVAFVRREGVFALAASFIAGAETELVQLLDDEGVPLIGAQTFYPPTNPAPDSRVFCLTSGLPGQCRAMVRFARENHVAHAQNVALLHPQFSQEDGEGTVHAGMTEAAKSIASTCAGLDWPLQLCPTSPQSVDASTWAQRLAGTDTTVVFSLIPSEQDMQFLRAAAAQRWHPICYLPGNLVGPELFEAPTGFDGRIFLSFGNLPSKLPVGIRAYNALAEDFELPSSQLATQFEALASMKALVQAAQQSGANLSRERLIEQFEAFREYRTGFAPPLTFGPNRRIGADGAYVVTVKLTAKRLMAVTDWVDGSEMPDRNP